MDFFPPIVDDPETFGEIAAANALSDVYAMGGTPRFALNMVCFPKKLPIEVLNSILAGSSKKAAEAGVVIAGGHSVEDAEVKYGLSVTGIVHPERIVANSGARPGDALVLTKPLGTGVLTSAVKAGKLTPEDIAPVIDGMRELNKAASEAMVEVGVTACTDITGYGLVGHAIEMARASNLTFGIESASVPLYPYAADMVKKRSCRPRTLLSTRDYLESEVVIAASVPEAIDYLLYDPQTSGGLLISVPAERLGALVDALKVRGAGHAVIGSVGELEPGCLVRIE